MTVVADPCSIPPIVDTAWLGEHVTAAADGPRWGDHPVMLCDVRSTMASAMPRSDFDADHISSAVYVSLEDDLSVPAAPVRGRHPLPSPEDFAAALDRLGIDDDSLVLGFDDRGGAFAARLVWMLRAIGQPAALLDDVSSPAFGVLVSQWLRGSTNDSRERGSLPRRRVRPWPTDAIADADRVTAHIADGGVVVDSRDAPRYAGEVEPIDAIAGHVPGAINVPFGGNLVDGRFRSAEELGARFAAAGVDGDAIVYCGSGVTACHNALAIEHAGHGRPALYVGSWSGWSTDPERPVATGPEP